MATHGPPVCSAERAVEMKLFAPRNDWNMSSPSGGNWWGMAGSYSTSSGVRVDETSAMKFSAVFAATRVISETLASLPCTLLKQKDARTTERATNHPLWTILHDQPNPERDIMSWLDSQVAFQVNWGNAYAEIQRDTTGNIVALWSIHPSRIPLRNIKRNGIRPQEYDGIEIGSPGEIVYFVNNDDGTQSPIAASDMLHVPGVLSTNGVTGQAIVKWAANSIGIAVATEAHAGALFKNGAVSNMAITSPKAIKPETATRLREQWQTVFGGVHNHYKTLILEEGMAPVTLNMDPESTQLLASRQFAVTEIARWYRLPPHLLADLSRSTNNNIEAQGLEFIIYSMLPWIVRWEKAMQRQLLTTEEKKSYRFKFNVNGLLRGDMAARAQFYQTMFNLGAFSPNMILEFEDMNPVEGGDQHFVQGNNAVPLDKIGELTQAQIDKASAASPAPMQPQSVAPQESRAEHFQELRSQMLKMIADHETAPQQIAEAVNLQSETKAAMAMQAVRDALQAAIQAEAEQMMRYESRAAKEAAKKPQAFLTWRDEFYPKFTTKLSTAISIFVPAANKIGVMIDSETEAEGYVAESIADLERLADLPCDKLEKGVDAIADAWGQRPKRLAESLFSGSAA